MTGSTFKTLTALMDGVPARKSAIPAPVLNELLSGGVIRLVRSARSWTIQCLSRSLLEGYIKRAVGSDDLKAYAIILDRKNNGEEVSRAEAAGKAGDSKAFHKAVMHGLRLNVVDPIEVTYGGEVMTLVPHRGTCIEIANPKLLVVPEDVVIVGVENYETFIFVKDYGQLFIGYGRCLFTYRDTSGKDAYRRMSEWLCSIRNRYLHFGDLDIYGINIYLDEFKARLGDRASFFIPPDFEERIRNGNRELYDRQVGLRVPDTSSDPSLEPLASAIMKYHRIVEQESLSNRSVSTYGND